MKTYKCDTCRGEFTDYRDGKHLSVDPVDPKQDCELCKLDWNSIGPGENRILFHLVNRIRELEEKAKAN